MGRTSFESHDHAACVAVGVALVDERCRQAGLQLTPVRRRVLEILLDAHRAFGAYVILDKLRQDGLGSQPPVAYRALDFLVRHGFAHKIESLNAFLACTRPGETHAPAFLICRICASVAEAESGPSRSVLAGAAEAAGFVVERTVIEAKGICPRCRQSGAP